MMSEKTISMIVAMANNRVIGKDNQMPWHLPAELQYFKKITMGKPMIMGRKTFDSIGKPLPSRQNIVLTRDKTWQQEGVTVAHSVEQALALAGDVAEVMIIGGASIYQLFLSQVNKLYLTYIDLDVEGEQFFPEMDLSSWQKLSQSQYNQDEKNPYNFTKVIWQK